MPKTKAKATTPTLDISATMKEAYILKLKISAMEKEYKQYTEAIKEAFARLNITTLSIEANYEDSPMVLKAEVVATTSTTLDRENLEVFLQSKGSATTKFLVSKDSSRFELKPVKG